MSQYFPEPYEPIGEDVNVKVDLSNNGLKTDLKGATEIDTSNLASKSDLVSFALIWVGVNTITLPLLVFS